MYSTGRTLHPILTATLFAFSLLNSVIAQPFPGFVAVSPETKLLLETNDIEIKAVAPIPGGGAYIGGSFQRAGSLQGTSLVKLNEDGSLDTTFKLFNTGLSDGSVDALLLQSDGKLIVGGRFELNEGRQNLVRLNSNGSVDTTFATKGVDSTVRDIESTSSGQFLVAGAFSNYLPESGSSVSINHVIILNADGSRDTTFTAPSSNGEVFTAFPLSGGKYLVGGSFNSVGGIPTSRLARLDADGTLDTTFAANRGLSTNFAPKVFEINQQSDGKIIVGGSSFSLAGSVVTGLLRLTADGLIDATFDPQIGSDVHSIIVLTDDSLLVGGSFNSFTGTNGFSQAYLAKILADGTPDSSFRPDVTAGLDRMIGMRLGENDRLWAVGFGGLKKPSPLTRVDLSDNSIAATLSHEFRRSAIAHAVVKVADDKTWLGGDFTHVNGERADGLVRLNADGTVDLRTDMDWKLNGAILALAPDTAGGLIVGGSFSSPGPTPGAGSYLVRIGGDGQLDPQFALASSSSNFSNGINNRVEHIAVGSDGKIVIAGAFSLVDGLSRDTIARLEADGQVDTTFSVGFNTVASSQIGSVLVDAEQRVYIGGTFHSFAGQSRGEVVRLHSSGGLDFTFPNLQINGPVWDMQFDSTGRLLVGGRISFVGSTFAPAVARFMADGTFDSTLGSAARIGLEARQLSIQSDGKILVGGSFTTSTSDLESPYLVRIQSDGSIDQTFGAFNINGPMNAFALLDSGQLMVGGDTTTTNTGITTAAQAPAITIQPVAVNGTQGGSATFTVGTTGSAPLTYSWFRDGEFVTTTTEPSLTLTDLSYEEVGEYHVVVTNPLDEATSSVAALIASDPLPVITGQPQPQNPGAGLTANLSIGATGDALSYIWRRNGVPIPGSTGPSLIITDVSLVDEGFYDAVVINGLSFTVSDTVALTVNPATQPSLIDLNPVQPALVGKINATLEKILPLPDGGAFLAGTFSSLNGQSTGAVVRINADGSLHPGFSPTEFNDANINDMVLQSDGKLVVGGQFTIGNSLLNLARLNPDGTVDSSYQSNGFSREVTSLDTTTDGRLIVGGTFTQYRGLIFDNYALRDNLAILHTDGTLDSTFAPPSISGGSAQTALELANGKILVSGSFNNIGGQSVSRLALFNSDGTLDSTFAPNGGFGSSFPNITAMAENTDGSLLLGGSFQTFDGQSVSSLLKLTANGELDQGFTTALGTINGSVQRIETTTDGSILIAGGFSSVGGVNRSRIAKLNTDGSLAPAAPDSSLLQNSSAATFAQASDGSLWFASHITEFDDQMLIRLTSELGLMNEFTPPVLRGSGDVFDSLIMPNNQVLIAGRFDVIGDKATQGLALVDADGAVAKTYDLSWNFSSDVQSLGRQSDGSIIAGGAFTSSNSDPGTANFLLRLRPDGTLDPDFATTPSSSEFRGSFTSNVFDVAIAANDSIIVSGQFSSFAGETVPRIVRLDRNGILDPTFNVGSSGIPGSITRIIVDPQNRVYVAGFFTSFANQTKSGVVRLNPDGSVDPSFANLQINQYVNDLAFDREGRLVVVGGFFSAAGGSAHYIARFSADGVRDTTFTNQGQINRSVRTVHLQSDGKILIGGDFTNSGDPAPNPYLRRLNSDGTIDATFIASGLSPGIDTITQRDDGRIYVGSQQGGASGLMQVATAPSITTQPQSQNVSAGDAVTLTVTAAGTAPLGYQWYRGDSLLTGENSASLQISNVGFTDIGSYSVEVENYFGSVRSEIAELTPSDEIPTITSQPISTSATAGETTSLSVTATGANLAFQWRLNGVPLPGATGASLDLNNLSLADAGHYDVQIVNGLVATLSSAATLTVHPTVSGNLFFADPANHLRLENDSGFIDTILPLADGRAYLSGPFKYYDHIETGPVIRLLADGTLDPSFEFEPTAANANIDSISLQSDGKLIVGGSFDIDGQVNLARINLDGSIDKSFRTRGLNGNVASVDVLSDDRILVGGGFFQYTNESGESINRSRIALIEADGTLLEPSFAPNLNQSVTAVLNLADGGFLIGGWFSQSDSESVNYLAKYDANGTLVTTFAPNGGFAANSFPSIKKLAEQPDGKILVAGTLRTYDGTTVSNVIRLSPSGELDTDFSDSLGSVTGSVNDLQLDSSGAIFITGQFGSIDSVTKDKVAKLNADGSLDLSFTVPGMDDVFEGQAIGLGVDQNLWLSARLRTGGALLLRAPSTTGAAPTTFGKPRSEGAINTAILLPGQRILAGGDFAYANGIPADGLVVIDGAGAIESRPDLSWNGNGTISSLLRQGDGSVLVGGQFSGLPNEPGAGNHLVRLQSDLSLDPEFGLSYSSANYSGNLSSGVTDLAAGIDGSFAAIGNFTSVGTHSRNRVAKFHRNGQLDLTFNPNSALGNGITPTATLVDSIGRVIIGSRSEITRLNPTGEKDSEFAHPSISGNSLLDLVFDAEGNILISGSLASIGESTWFSRYARLTPNGQLDTTFASTNNVNDFVRRLTVLPDGRILIAGSFRANSAESPDKYLTRLNNNGSPDFSFKLTGLNNPAQIALLRDDGSIFIGGASGSFTGIASFGSEPTIITEVANQTAAQGDSVTFSVTATGTGELTYQWYHDGSAISGATNASLNISSVTATDGGNYWVIVTGVFGEVRSATATLSGVVAKPVVSITPSTANSTVGENVTFSVVSDSTTPTYQWLRNGHIIPGANDASLTLEDVKLTDADRYQVRVIDGPSLSEFDSNAALLRVFPAKFPTAIAPNPAWNVELAGGHLDNSRPISGIFPLPDGGGIIVGRFAELDGHSSTGAARIDANETVDTSFRAPQFEFLRSVDTGSHMTMDGSDRFLSIAIPSGFQPSGNIDQTVRRFDLQGSDTETFVLDSELGSSFAGHGINAIAIDSSRRVLIAWSTFDSETQVQVVTLVRCLDDGSWDRSFPTQLLNGSIQQILVQADNSLLVGGRFDELNGNPTAPLVRFDVNGVIDTSFAANLVVPENPDSHVLWPLHETPSGELYLGESWQLSGFPTQYKLSHISAGGTPIRNWEITSTAKQLEQLPNGELIFAGDLFRSEPTSIRGLGKIDSDGNLTEIPLPFGNYSVEFANISASFNKAWLSVVDQSTQERHYAAIDLTDNSISAWSPEFKDHAFATAIEPLDHGDWLVAGDFSSVNGVATSNLVRLDSNGGVVGTYGEDWGPEEGVYRLQRRSDGKINIVSEVDRSGLFKYRRLNSDGSIDITFTPELDAPSDVLLMLDLPGGESLLSSWFLGIENNQVITTKRLLPDGSLDITYPSQTTRESPPLAGLLQRDGAIVLGRRPTSGFSGPLKRLTANDEVDSSFTDNAAINDMIIGLATAYDESTWVFTSDAVTRLAQDGSQLATTDTDQSHFYWSYYLNPAPTQSLALPDGDMLVGNFLTAKIGAASATTPIVRLNPDLTFDTDNFTTVGINEEVTAMRLTDSGQLILAVLGRVFMTEAADDFAATVAADTSESSVPAGGSISLSVDDAPAGELTYQWRKDGQNIVGATAATLSLTSLSSADAGNYDVVIGWALGEVTAGTYTLDVEVVQRAITNISSRITLPEGETAFVPFRIEGSGNKKVLLRAVGPTLAGFGVSATMTDPYLQLLDGRGELITENDDWENNAQVQSLSSQVGAFGLDTDGADAALVATLTPGNYIAVVNGDTGGTLLVEMYDAESENLESRFVYTGLLSYFAEGSAAMFTGFVNTADDHPLLMRALGPGTGLAGALLDPQLTLLASGNEVQSNDNWNGAPTLAEAFTLAGATPLVTEAPDSAISGTFASGAYTLTSSPPTGQSGQLLHEVFDLSSRQPARIPTLLVPPLSQRVSEGGDVRFEVLVTGTQPMTYQWNHDGIALADNNTAHLDLTGVTADTAGAYTVTISNSTGQITTTPVNLAIGSPYTPDSNQDGRIELSELLRVIELYNTRFGTSRTGRYQVSESSDDGFDPDASRSGAETVSLGRFHAADTDRNGQLNLSELLRVIELYNYRSGTIRTGEYHNDVSKPDGVSSGPDGP